MNLNEKEIKKKNKKNGEKKIIVTIFKLAAVLLIFVLQLFIMSLLYSTAKGLYDYANVIFNILKIATILYILYNHETSAFKISWIVFIALIPVVGIIAYILWGNSKLRPKKEKQIKKVRVESEYLLKESRDINKELLLKDKYKYNLVNYVTNMTGYPLYKNEGTDYFDTGEKLFECMKKDLLDAKKYILLEFYILTAGKLSAEILDILRLKREQGVKVDIILDSLGCMFRLPKKFKKTMEEAGIDVHVFNPPNLIINGYINYRDHRKIIVIDGSIAYTGGVNLADEYVNIIEKFGHWKDGGIKIIGKPAWSFSLMFLRTLNQISDSEVDYKWYMDNIEPVEKKEDATGYIIPLEDGPDNRKNPIENLYIQTINYAKEYICITTPYFIISEAMLTALLTSARSGVNVSIMVPHIPDKKAVFAVTRSYYEVLLEAGINVYEYEPGFVHAKTLVADDDTSIVGTANLDFRSMHLNFECVAWTYKTGNEKDIKNDFDEMVKNSSIKISLEKWKNRSFAKKVTEAILAAFAPMM